MELLNCHPNTSIKFAQSKFSRNVLRHFVYMYCYLTKQKAYERMIEILSEETNPNPGKIKADFGKAPLVASRKKFPPRKTFLLLFSSYAIFQPENLTKFLGKLNRKRYLLFVSIFFQNAANFQWRAW